MFYRPSSERMVPKDPRGHISVLLELISLGSHHLVRPSSNVVAATPALSSGGKVDPLPLSAMLLDSLNRCRIYSRRRVERNHPPNHGLSPNISSTKPPKPQGLDGVFTGGREHERVARSVEAALTVRDNYGRILTPKERFRQICYS